MTPREQLPPPATDVSEADALANESLQPDPSPARNALARAVPPYAASTRTPRMPAGRGRGEASGPAGHPQSLEGQISISHSGHNPTRLTGEAGARARIGPRGPHQALQQLRTQIYPEAISSVTNMTLQKALTPWL